MDYQDSLSKSSEILEKLFSSLEESLSDLKVSRREGYFLGIYLSIMEYSEELIFLMKNNMTTVLPIVCRTIIEKTIDIELLTEDPDYLDRLEMNTLKRADSIAEFILRHKKYFGENIEKREIRNRKIITDKLSDIKKKGGIKPISGLLSKFKLSKVSEDPIMYWAMDRMSQEVHTDTRDIFFKYQNKDKVTNIIDKPYMKPRRDDMKKSDKLKYLILIMESVLYTSRCIIDKFELKYQRTIEYQLQEIENIKQDYSELFQ